ncbi:hypothetical protein [Gracilibacillus timonensis]|uniref:hypothetical protein n=1 Tax=Gracilibacillus timonensis TaxID=1816696 RepID=UPI000826AD6E|nr:hypothetical protein [Gracilibacillus timonensis]
MLRTCTILMLLSIVMVMTACNISGSEETSSEGSEVKENQEQQQEKTVPEDTMSDDGQQNSATDESEQSSNTTDDESSDDRDIAKPELYEPEEVSGRDNPEEGSGDVYPEALENLELPYIYENTLVYSGTINPEQSIRFEISQPDSEEVENVDPEVTEQGHFALPLDGMELEAGDELIVYVMGNMPHEQQFVLPIQPAEDGMELVESTSDTAVMNDIKEATDLPEFYENTSTYYGKTLPGVSVEVSEVDAFVASTQDLEVEEEGDFHGDFSNFPYQAAGEAGLQEGQHLLFRMTDEDGNLALFLTDILAPSDDPNYDGPISE